MTDTITADVVVVGCGAAGLAAAAELARRGRRVVGLDRFEPGHTRGSSHGTERIVRVPYTDSIHVEMVLASLDGWRRIERDADTTLLTRTGGIDAGTDDELDLLARACADAGVATTRCSAADAMARFSSDGVSLFRFSTDVLHHDLAATVHADRTLETLRSLALAAGAELLHGTEVTDAVMAADGHVTIHHAGGTVDADTCVVTTGAWGSAPWLSRLLAPAATLPPLRVTQEQVAFFVPRCGGDDLARTWPTFIMREQPSIYGMPTPDGLVKIAEHHTGPEVDPDTRSGDLEPQSWERLVRWVAANVPGVDPVPVRSATCLYASFPGDTFLLDRVGPVVVGLGLSGHGFKFVPEVGRRLADLAEGRPWPDSPFGFDRPAIEVGASGQR